MRSGISRRLARQPKRTRRRAIERLISRVLDRFGAAKSAEKALERALEAAPRDKRQPAATIGQIVGRAFVKGDLAARARRSLRGLGGGARSRRHRLLRALGPLPRAPAARARATTRPSASSLGAADDPRWIGRVAAFGAGKLKAEQLVAAAQTPTQKTEALFYAAMDRKASGDAKGADEGLRSRS